MPVPETSSAVARPICCTSAGSRVAPRPMLCGKIVAPYDVVVAVHRVDAVDQRDAAAAWPAPRCWKPSYMSAHAAGGVRRGRRAAAGEQRAEPVLGDLGAVLTAARFRA